MAAVDSPVGLWMRFPCATAGDWDGLCTARRYLLPAAAAGLIVRCGRVSRLIWKVSFCGSGGRLSDYGISDIVVGIGTVYTPPFSRRGRGEPC